MGNAPTKGLPKKGNKKYVHWSNADKPSPPGKPQLVPGTPHNQPDVVTIRWEPPVNDGGAPITGYLVEHRRTGSPHWVRATPSLVTNAELTLSGLEPGWRYQFRVSAENAAGISEPGELSEPLTVTLQRSAAAAPHFTQELKDTTALENEKAEFLVHYRGTPTPKIAWFKDGFEIFSSRRTKILTENETSSLVIFQAAFSDEGEVKCTATNRVGHVVTKAKLRLEAPPRIRLPRQYEDGLLFEMDEIIKLKVSVAGRPLPRVTWFHNGEQVVFGGRYEVANTDRYSSLRVGEAKRHDRGEYQVKATNRLGEDVVSVLVTVTDRPVPPGKAKVVMTLGRSVTLSWTKPEDDGGCKIGNYIVEYYRVGWNVWLKAATCRQLTTTLGDLIEGSEYKFRLKAENPYGVSDPSGESEVVFIPDPKRGIMEAPARGSQSRLAIEQVPLPVAVPLPVQQRDDRKRRRPPIRDSNIPRKEKHLDSSMEYPSSDPDSAAEVNFKPRQMDSKRGAEKDTKGIPVTVLEYQKQDIKGGKENAQKPESPKFKQIEKSKLESMSVPKTKPFREISSRVSKPVRDDSDDMDLVPEVYSLKIPVGRSTKSEERDGRKTPTGLSPREDDRSIVHDSSEMMLVLLPETRDAQSETDKEQHADFCRSFTESNNLGVAPPMSLSSPELGCGEPVTQGALRNAVSSTELLHELAMERLYQEAEAEEASARPRRHSLERARSFERPNEPSLQARNALRMGQGQDKAMTDKQGARAQDKTMAATFGLSARGNKPVGKKVLTEEEEEEAEFARLRERIKRTLEEDSKEVEREMRYKKEDTPPEDDEVDEEDEGTLDDEDLEEEEDEEEEDEDIDEEELEEESEENPEEEDGSDEEAYSNKHSKKDTGRTPPLRSMDHNRYSDDEEEEPYHPRSMVPRAVAVKELPPPPVPVHREILTVMTLDDNLKESAAPVRHEPKSDLNPKPILKTSSKFGKEETKSKAKPPSPRASTPFGSEAKTKTPMLNKILDKIESPFKKSQTAAGDGADSSGVVRRQKKSSPTTSTSKAPAQEAERREGDVGLSAAEIARKRRLQTRQSSLEEDQEANKIIIDHYSDIVKEYGIPKKYSPTLYLNTEDLKKAVNRDEDEIDKSVSTSPEIAPEKSSMLAKRYSKPVEKKAREDIFSKYTARDDIDSPQYTPSTSPTSSRGSKPYSPTLSQSPAQSPTQAPVSSRRYVPEYTPTPSPDLKPSKQKPSASEVKSQQQIDRYSDEESEEDIPWEFTPQHMMARIRRSLTPKRSFRRQRPDPAVLAKTAESRVNNFITYLSDWAMFLLACWLYLFKDERLAIPVLLLMVYRQMNAAILGWIPERWRRKKE